MRELRFQSLSALQEKGVQADKANYQFIYHGKLEENQTLDSLFEQFNFDHPEGFCGHSLSVSDVVLLRREGLVDAFYVDSSGFVEITFGLDQLRAYQVGSHYLEIQTTEGGYDYTFYDAACQELDGGILENSTITIQEAVKELTDDRYAAAAIKSFDPDTLFEKIEEVNALAKAENRSRTTEYQRVR